MPFRMTACLARTRFNGAVPLGHGIRIDGGFGQRRLRRFNGAVPLGHGIRCSFPRTAGPQMASMGPCLWGTEYTLTTKRCSCLSLASMGPCLWGTEYRGYLAGCCDPYNASMGPCLWGTEYISLPFTCGRSAFASMGPCLWGTEYKSKDKEFSRKGALQWGRAFGARNTGPSIRRRCRR